MTIDPKKEIEKIREALRAYGVRKGTKVKVVREGDYIRVYVGSKREDYGLWCPEIGVFVE